MKNIDIESIERKNIYITPEFFFEEMQSNVLNKTVEVKEKKPKIFKLNYSFVSSIAAAIVIIFGITFFWKTNQTDFTKPKTENPSNKINNTVAKNTATENIITNESEKNISELNTNNVKETSAVAQNDNLKKREISKNTESSDEHYDQILSSLSDEELTAITSGQENDIYLELYN